jgi:KAP family P-loop domain
MQSKVTDAQRELDAKVDEAQRELDESATAIQAAQSAAEAARKEAARLETEMKTLSAGRLLGEFLQERSRSDDYRRHLGLLATVRDDLGKLEELVRSNNETGREPGLPNRIILYIDDLDRCPPDKVVEVLEAVHLLLALELFVVVVAVDSRWLSHALTDQLKALNTFTPAPGLATPQDYLEKIFQLPFWVQPLSADARRSLVHGLLEGSLLASADAAANGGSGSASLTMGEVEEELLTAMLSRRSADPRLDAHLLALTADDLRFIESLAPILGDTPRRVKRFVNVTQLLLAFPPALQPGGAIPSDRHVVAFLAAVNSGLPGLAPTLFDAVRAASDAASPTPPAYSARRRRWPRRG